MGTLPMREGPITWTWAADYLAVVASARGWSDQAYSAVRSYLDTLARTYADDDRRGWAAYAAFLQTLPESMYPGSTKLAAAMAGGVTEADDTAEREAIDSWWEQLVGAAELSAADVAEGAQAVREAGETAADVAGKSSTWLLLGGLLVGGLLWKVTR